jgi:hypothetical protein
VLVILHTAGVLANVGITSNRMEGTDDGTKPLGRSLKVDECIYLGAGKCEL